MLNNNKVATALKMYCNNGIKVEKKVHYFMPVLKRIKRFKYSIEALMGSKIQKNVDPWDSDYWSKLSNINDRISDKEFLRLFKPLLKTFRKRIAYLYQCAEVTVRLYKKCKILEPVSGCNLFPDIMDSFGYRVIGLEKKSSLAARFCRIKNIPILNPEQWESNWTDEKFDLIILICYFTAPDAANFGARAIESLCNNVFPQIQKRAELLVFDERYIAPLKKKAEELFLPIEVEIMEFSKSFGAFRRFDKLKFAIFSEKGNPKYFRK